jgi:hypothetical protein
MLAMTIVVVTALLVGAVLIVPILRSNSASTRRRDDGEGGSGGGGLRRKPRPPAPTGGVDDPSWWPAFEREFATYTAQHKAMRDGEPITCRFIAPVAIPCPGGALHAPGSPMTDPPPLRYADAPRINPLTSAGGRRTCSFP